MRIAMFLVIALSFVACNGGGLFDFLDGDHKGDNGHHDNDTITLPASIHSYISENYPTYTIEESEEGLDCDSTSIYEVELKDGNNEIELVFDTESNFLYSETEIQSADLPAAVTSSITTNFPNYTLEDHAEKMTMADDTIQYEVELEGSPDDLEVIFAADGTVICQMVEED